MAFNYRLVLARNLSRIFLRVSRTIVQKINSFQAQKTLVALSGFLLSLFPLRHHSCEKVFQACLYQNAKLQTTLCYVILLIHFEAI